MATGTQEARNKCSICGKVFDTAEEAKQHEKTCTSRDRVAGNPQAAKDPNKTKKDATIEDRFEATDN